MKGKKQSKKLIKYKTLEQLGSGAYGTVYKGELRHLEGEDTKNHQYFALKQIKLSQPEEGMPSTAIRQIAILKELKHPNIVKLYQVITQPTALTLVFEHLQCDLKKFMNAIPKDKGMDSELIKSFCYQLIKGVDYCHQKNVLHRDLKPQNLLISKNNLLKLADFGLARGFGIPTKGFTHQVVTLWYRAPDILLQSRQYQKQIDVWSIGCIFAEMATLKPLFTGANQAQQIETIFNFFGVPDQQSWESCQKLPGWKKYEQEFVNLRNEAEITGQKPQFPHFPKLGELGNDLLQKMIQLNPRKRISTAQALQHPYFKDLPENVHKIYSIKNFMK